MSDLIYGHRSSLEDVLTKFSPMQLPDFSMGGQPRKGHIFITRPSLPIYSGSNVNASYGRNPLISKHLIGINERFTRTLTDRAGTPFIPILHKNARKGFSIDDRELKSVEKGNTFYGLNTSYAINSESHKIGRTFSIEYENDKYDSIYRIHSAWRDIIGAMYTDPNLKVPVEHLVYDPTLLYYGAIYYFVTESDNSEIVFSYKEYIYPNSIPDSMYSSSGDKILNPTVTIGYKSAFSPERNDIDIILDFNSLSVSSRGNLMSLTKTIPGRGEVVNTNLAKSPYIVEDSNLRKFYLVWGE
jgi:hypothetical protein